MAHPRTFARGTRPANETEALRAIVYSTDDRRVAWVEAELARGKVLVQIARSVAHVVSALTEDPPPRPQILVIDLDALSPGELLELHAIRDHGWTGTIVALGNAPVALRVSLDIGRMLAAPYDDDSLVAEVARYRQALEGVTVPIPVIE